MNNRLVGAVLLLGGVFVLSGCGLKATPGAVPPQPQEDEPAAQNEISAEEQEFLDSGRAKAVMGESDLWQLYENEAAGLTLQYPFDVDLDSGLMGQPYILSVAASFIDGLEGTMGYNEATATGNRAALEDGLYGESVDFPFEESKKLRQVGERHAQDFLVFGRFEVCDVVGERKLYFFSGERQVVLTLAMPRDAFAVAAADYLTVDETNCGETLVWGDGEMERLYSDLMAGTAPPVLQRWYDRFDEIVGTMRFDESGAGEPSLIGRWISLDDDMSVIEFTADTKKDYYDGEPVNAEAYSFEADGRLSVAMGDDEPLLYEIVELTETDLTLRYLGRGNDLHYRRME